MSIDRLEDILDELLFTYRDDKQMNKAKKAIQTIVAECISKEQYVDEYFNGREHNEALTTIRKALSQKGLL